MSKNDEVKGQLFEKWVDDLINDRRPSIVPEINQLHARDVEEVHALARWCKGNFTPTVSSTDSIEACITEVLSSTAIKIEDEYAEAFKISENSGSFGKALRLIRMQKGVSLSQLEARVQLPTGVLGRVEADELPPHRLDLDKMVKVLRILRFVDGVIALIKATSLAWIEMTSNTEQIQLARVNFAVSDSARKDLLSSDSVDYKQNEIEKLSYYCENLEKALY